MFPPRGWPVPRLPDAVRAFRTVNALGSLHPVLTQVLPIRIAILAVLMETAPIFTQVSTVLHDVSRILA